MCFIMTFSALSHSLIDSGCKNKNQAKREKRRPPGTVEFIVSKTTLVLLICSVMQLVLVVSVL